MKTCRICKLEKDISEFYKNRTKKDGHHDECKPCKVKLVKENHKGLTYRFSEYKRAAKLRGHIFTLSKEIFDKVTSQPCKYCGGFNKELNGKKFCGVDRIDNDQGYVSGNVVSCCSACNFMKRAMSETRFLEHIRRIYEFNNLSNL